MVTSRLFNSSIGGDAPFNFIYRGNGAFCDNNLTPVTNRFMQGLQL